MFERIINVVGVQLDRGWLGGPGVHREVHQVGGRTSAFLSPSLPSGSVARSEELMVVELVAASTSVALVLGHGVGHALVHVDVHLGAEHRHVVT